MSVGRVLVWALIAAPSLVVTGPAFSQGTAQRDGFEFGPTSVAVAFDSGITAASTSPFADQLINVTPTTVTYTKGFRRSNLRFSYTPEIELYGRGSTFNSLDHQARAAYGTEVSRSVRLDASGSFVKTNDRSRQTGNLTLAPRGRFIQGQGGVGLTYTINDDTTLAVRANSSWSEIGLTPTATASESIRRLSTVVGANLSRSLGRSHAVTANYGYLRSSARDPRVVDLQKNETDNVSFGYRFNTRFGLNAGATFGIVRRRRDDTYTQSMSANISKAWRDISFDARYARTVAGLLILVPSGTLPPAQIQDPTLVDRVVNSAALSFNGSFIRRIRVNQGFRWSRAPGRAQDEFFESLAGRTYVSVRAGNTVAPYVSVTYWLQNTRLVVQTASRFRFSAGLQFYWNRLVGAPGPGS